MRAVEFIGEGIDYMAGHCHVMALALKQLHPNWQLRAHIGWEEEAEDEDDYRIDHVYIVAPDGSAYDCRGKFSNEAELVGPDQTGGIETQFVNYTIEDIQADVARGELKNFSQQDVEKALAFIKKTLGEDYHGPDAIQTPGLSDALADWSEMHETVQSVSKILSSIEAKPFRTPPAGITALYRAIVPKDREINSIKSNGKIIAYATNINGAHQFIETLDIDDRYVIIKKAFHPQDFMLDFTSMFETYDYGSQNERYISEHEIWMKPTPYYKSAKKEEIVYDSLQQGVTEAEAGTEYSRDIDREFKRLGYKKLGSGADSKVWAADNDYIIKILMPDEPMSRAGEIFRKFYEFCQEHPDIKCLPKINESNTIDVLGKEYIQIDMERLTPLRKNSFEEGVVWFLSDYVANGRPWETVMNDLSGRHWEFYNKRQAARLAELWKGMSDQQLRDVKELYDVMSMLYKTGQINKFGWDLHTENVMKRRDGTLVIIDPWFSMNEKSL